MSALLAVPPVEAAALPRLLAARDPAYGAHVARFGALPSAEGIADLVDLAGLTGRGGAGFPTAAKIAATGRGGAVIANGSEGEPLSLKDATLLSTAPHLVLDGLLLAARAVGAKRAAIVVKASSEPVVRRALAERADARAVTVHIAPDAFTAGEASAVVNLVGHGRAVPTDRVRRLTESGLRGRPTLVQNVETLAHVALVARWGDGWFRALGTDDDPGSRLVTVSGDVPRSGVLEVAGGTTIAAVLGAAGADPRQVAAVLVGGYHGAWLRGADLALPLSDRALRPLGAAPGAGVLHVLERGRCGLRAADEIVGWLAGQSAGQCGPCVHGLPALARATHALASTTFGDRGAVLRAADVVDGRGSCHHPDGTARFARSATAAFADEIALHARGRCSEGAR